MANLCWECGGCGFVSSCCDFDVDHTCRKTSKGLVYTARCGCCNQFCREEPCMVCEGIGSTELTEDEYYNLEDESIEDE